VRLSAFPQRLKPQLLCTDNGRPEGRPLQRFDG
jgi:hypothetical protein